jgi:hypothetical protein
MTGHSFWCVFYVHYIVVHRLLLEISHPTDMLLQQLTLLIGVDDRFHRPNAKIIEERNAERQSTLFVCPNKILSPHQLGDRNGVVVATVV